MKKFLALIILFTLILSKGVEAQIIDQAVLYWKAGASKAGTSYSIIPSSGAGDFNFVRGSPRSIITSDGQMKNIGVNYPATNWIDGTPVLSLEPYRKNLITTQETFSDFILSGATLEGDPTTAGSELVANGDFSSGNPPDDWVSTRSTLATISGEMQVTATADYGYGRQDFTTTELTTYKLTFDYWNTLGDIAQFQVYNVTGGADIIPRTDLDDGQISVTKTIYFQSPSSSVSVRIILIAKFSGDIVYFDNISVKEVTGYPSPHIDFPTSARKLVATSANGYIELDTPIDISNETDYANSIWVKRALGTGDIFIKDINNAEITIAVDGTWRKFDVVSESTSTSGQIGIKLATSGDEVYIAFAQAEKGYYATSFIYDGTEGSQQEREADLITGAGDASIFNSEEGTIFFHGSTPSDGVNKRFSLALDINNRIAFQINNAAIQVYFVTATPPQALTPSISAIATDETFTFVFTWKKNSLQCFANGTAGSEITTAIMFPAGKLTTASFTDGGGGVPFFGEVELFYILNTALSYEEALELSNQ